MSRRDPLHERVEVAVQPLDLLLDGERLLDTPARCRLLAAPHVQRAVQVGTDVEAHRVALTAGPARLGRGREGDAVAGMRGQAQRAHAAAQEAAVAGGGAQGQADESGGALEDEIAAIGRGQIGPAQEVQVVPVVEVRQILGQREAFGRTLRAVDERGTDVVLGQGFHEGSFGVAQWMVARHTPRGPRGGEPRRSGRLVRRHLGEMPTTGNKKGEGLPRAAEEGGHTAGGNYGRNAFGTVHVSRLLPGRARGACRRRARRAGWQRTCHAKSRTG